MLKMFFFIDIWFEKQDIQKWLKTKICSFYGEFGNEQKKDKKNFDLPEQGYEPQIFSNFPAHDLNFHGKWGWRDQIKTSF
jgi:hypothetical protein